MFLKIMSNFSGIASLQLPISWATAGTRAWFPEDCMLCAARCRDGPVCPQCASALPRAGYRCAHCASPLDPGALCSTCRRRQFAFDDATACFEYRFPIDRLVQRYKYAADFACGRWLCLELARCVEREARPDVLVAPPLSAERLRERGFNQALELAKAVGAHLEIRCDPAALARVRDTPAQAGLSRRERFANLRRAFRVRRALDGAHVAIVDDVLTTGATAEAIARELKRAGARRVSVWAVARAPEPGKRRCSK